MCDVFKVICKSVCPLAQDIAVYGYVFFLSDPTATTTPIATSECRVQPNG